MKAMTWTSEWFYGNKISNYGLENGYVDYGTLAKAFQAVLNNNIISATGWENWDKISGIVSNAEEIDELEEKIDELLETVDEDDEEVIELRDKVAELEEEENYEPEIFQYYIVDDNGATILEEANEIVFYNEELDMYVWGVTHYGTAWDYVLTNIKIEKED